MNYLKQELYQLIKADESIFNFIQEFAIDGLWFYDFEKPENVFIDLKFWSILGYNALETITVAKNHEKSIYHGDIKIPFECFASLATNHNQNKQVIVRYNHKSDFIIWTNCVSKIILNNLGKPHRVLWAVNDITLGKQREKLLDDTNRLARIGTWEVDLRINQPIWNKVTKEIHEVPHDYSPNLDTAINFFKEGENRQKITQAVDQAILEGTSYDIELQIITAKKNEKWVRAIGLTEFENGICLRLYGTFQDITEKKKTEFLLRQNNDLNKIFIQQSPNAVAMFDKNMNYMAASEKWLTDYRLIDYNLNENLIGESYYKIFPETPDNWKQIHLECLQGAKNTCKEVLFERLDGRKQWISWDIRPWYVSDNNIGGLLMSTVDITERKIIENKLRISEITGVSAFENAAIGMALVNPKGKLIKVNKSLCDILGYTEKELTSCYFPDITHPDDLDKDLENLESLVKGKVDSYQMEKRYFDKEKNIIWAILAVSIIRKNSGEPIYFISQITDISDRKKIEQNLNHTLSKLEGILQASSQVAIISTNNDGIITSFNKGAENLLGYKADDLVNKLTPSVIHKKEELEIQANKLFKQKGIVANGFEVFLENAKTNIFDPLECTYVCKNGTSFPVQLIVTPIKNETGIEGFLFIATDISKIKAVENEIKTVLDVTNDQNKRLLNFAHIVSHNLRSHSGNLSMLLDCIETETDEDSKNSMFNMLHQAAGNLQETVEHLNEVVAMNSKITESLKPINLYIAVNHAIGNIQGLLNSVSGICKSEIDNSVYVDAVPAYLDSIILNFLTNAIKYKSEKRNLTIDISIEQEIEYVILLIKDNGLGIDLKMHGDKIFGMYKTFHKHKDARGIGLFITKNQIEAIGGKIEVESEIEYGTTFKIYFKKSFTNRN